MDIEKIKEDINGLIEEGTDEEVLAVQALFFDRVMPMSRFIVNSDDLITHSMMAFVSGDKVLASEPEELDWPLQQLPKPQAMESN